MEEFALYRAVIENPHDDTARLVYADWLDEFADTLPEPHARFERGRAELIRVQCRIARRSPRGWGWDRDVPLAPELLKRQKRLRFLFSEKLRRGLPGPLAGHPFDRGFFRPLCHLRPYQFLRDPMSAPAVVGAAALPSAPGLTLPREHPMRRYVASDDPFDMFPLWDVHLCARAEGGYLFDPWADFGQYGELLARCARSPALARIGWLKVSFFRTPAVEFFRTGNFANVETLVLNCVPFPDVLEAVAGNETFRSLRYIEFGDDEWAWCVTPAAGERIAELGPKIAGLNNQHLPYGEMRSALHRLLGGLEPIPPVRLPLRMPEWARLPKPAPADLLPPSPALALIRERLANPKPPAEDSRRGIAIVVAVFAVLLMLACVLFGGRSEPMAPAHKFDDNPDRFKVPPAVYEIEKWKAPKADPPSTDRKKGN
ncbi:MAG TPA: TIGR02996 domain-containing protein [Gemmata sp.]